MTKEEKQAKSGKGKTRVEIAQAAWERAMVHQEACKARLDKAKEAEAAGAGKRKEKEAKKHEAAIRTLMAAGMTKPEAESALRPKKQA